MAADVFISEPIKPDVTTMDAAAAARGVPAVPRRFVWRKRVCEVQDVLRAWTEREADRTHGSGERYTRKHWFEVRTDDGSVMRIYFQRQPVSRRAAKARWWLYSLAEADTEREPRMNTKGHE